MAYYPPLVRKRLAHDTGRFPARLLESTHRIGNAMGQRSIRWVGANGGQVNTNDGTQPCPTCLSAGSISTIKAVADLRAQLASVNEQVERRMSSLLDAVENPASILEGAPGSLHRRAWEIGHNHRRAIRQAEDELKRRAEAAEAERDSLRADLARLRSGATK